MLLRMYRSAKILLWLFTVLLFAIPLHGQELRKVTDTPQFTEYHFTNDSLAVVHAYEFMVPKGLPQTFQVIEQQVVSRKISRNPDAIIEAQALFPDDTPLFEIVNPGEFRGEKVANLRFHPTRYKSASTEEMVIVREARFRVYKQQLDRRARVQQFQQQSSPLQSGTWYKIPVPKTGIYQIDAEYLTDLGINLSAIDPRNIQVWGTKGGELPRLNSAEKPEFAEIPISVEGEANGSFNSGDQIIFYAEAPHEIFRDNINGSFSHQIHRYSDYNYLFLTIGNQPGRRISDVSQPSGAQMITEFRDFRYFEQEIYKSEPRIRSGLSWYSQRFGASGSTQSQTIFDETIPGLISGRDLDIEIQAVGRSTQPVSMSFSYGNENIGSLSFPSIGSYSSEEGTSGHLRSLNTTTQVTDGNSIQISAQLNATEPNSEGFIDWVRVSYDRELTADDNYLFIYAPTGTNNQAAAYRISGFSSQPIVMEVSDMQNPVRMQPSQSGNDYEFSFNHTDNNRFIAQSSLFTPQPGEQVENQNLRGISHHPDYVIVTSEFFLDQAEEWANYRQQKDNFETVVVTQNQIFNEFSGGVPDVTAIRDYIKFLYDRAHNSGQEPLQHLLLFGGATFDFKNILEGPLANHVFTFQSDESLHRINSYGSDDYFGLLGDDEGEWERFSGERIDIGIGRFPVNTRQEADIIMNKIRQYESEDSQGDWRTRFVFAADDDFPNIERNRDMHTLNAEGTALEIDITETATRIDRIYMLSYPVETSAAGRRIPEATRDLINSFNRGSLVINYSGHGNQFVLADERLFTADMIPQLTNSEKLSIFVTATCSFGRFDDNESNSGAEQTLLWENGGVVAAFTTTRVVFTGGTPGDNNFGLNIQLTRQMVERDAGGRPQRLGDIYMNTKNTSQGANFNARKFILLGDPAMRIGLPEKRAKITSINSVNLEQFPDSIQQVRSLDKLTFEGIVTDHNGNQMVNYNGEANVTVFDAQRTVNLPNLYWVEEGRCFLPDCQYVVETDVLFNGRVSVSNGQFQSEFIVPKDISFSENTGRILAYTSSSTADGSGSTSNLVFNGVNPDAAEDTDGPEIDLYLNDKNFVNGNLVGSSSTLYVELEDQSGINTTGTGVGHEIIATIDTNPKRTFVLNDFYSSELDNFRRGTIEYPLEDLPAGNHTLTVRAWDVYNNPSEKSIHFEVADSEQLQIRNVYNYPNPMNNRTRFVFEHNQPGNVLDIDIRIFTLSGAPVTHLKESQITSNSYANIEWNGLDRDYDRLANGTYIYVLRVGADTPEGRQTREKIEKLVIIR